MRGAGCCAVLCIWAATALVVFVLGMVLVFAMHVCADHAGTTGKAAFVKHSVAAPAGEQLPFVQPPCVDRQATAAAAGMAKGLLLWHRQ